MKFGARIIKTGIAVAITMFICRAVNLEPAFFGAVSAVVNMQPSIYLTMKTARDQVLVHFIGVIAGFFFGYFLGVNPLSAGLIAILLIAIYSRLQLSSGITMGIVAALFVLSSSTAEFFTHALVRSAVIFIGLGTAMAINVLLWPPRYNQQFKEKLRLSNEYSVRYFCRAVELFAQLGSEKPEIDQAGQATVYRQNKEARALYDLLRREREVNPDELSSHTAWLSSAGKLLDYNRSLVEKGERIYELLPARYERRVQAGSPPISEEFKTILAILEGGCTTITRLNTKLRSAIIDGAMVEPEEISENYWERLSKAIEEWQPKLTGSYYLHGLMDAAVTANEIKWAARQAKILLLESMEKAGQGKDC
ncbi:MAG: aromatic acid exporter family protein [Negativicutes bacterium]|nr:aromatic acid exporter family protein [Negativicutes bacterium]